MLPAIPIAYQILLHFFIIGKIQKSCTMPATRKKIALLILKLIALGTRIRYKIPAIPLQAAAPKYSNFLLAIICKCIILIFRGYIYHINLQVSIKHSKKLDNYNTYIVWNLLLLFNDQENSKDECQCNLSLQEVYHKNNKNDSHLSTKDITRFMTKRFSI